jgi:hypothetical protein
MKIQGDEIMINDEWEREGGKRSNKGKRYGKRYEPYI